MLIVSLIVLCVNILMMIVLYRKILHNFSQNAYRDRIREEVNRLILDIEHESDHAVTVLEAKIRQVEKLLADTDRHLALVEQEHEKWAYQKQFIDEYRAAKTDAGAVPENSAKDTIRIYTKNIGTAQPAAVSALNPREQVIELARQGFSIDFIAEKVDLPLGEIALILSIDG
ncbi:MAG: hypothetical protein P1P65_01270 [Treponema sp.]